jgi:hypothetical protein
MTTETNRYEFEEWAKQAGYWLHTNPYDEIAKYYDSSDTESAWEAWQAAREQVTEQRDAVTLRLGRTQEKMFDAERQRDRLAEALTKIARGEPNWADCVVLAREALQSLNQPERTI